MKIVIYEDGQGEFRWKAIARNGENVGNGSEGYVTRSNARRAARRFKVAILTAKIVDA
jgi:uncharacterized protein YegP (UPF0339 family)